MHHLLQGLALFAACALIYFAYEHSASLRATPDSVHRRRLEVSENNFGMLNTDDLPNTICLSERKFGVVVGVTTDDFFDVACDLLSTNYEWIGGGRTSVTSTQEGSVELEITLATAEGELSVGDMLQWNCLLLPPGAGWVDAVLEAKADAVVTTACSYDLLGLDTPFPFGESSAYGGMDIGKGKGYASQPRGLLISYAVYFFLFIQL